MPAMGRLVPIILIGRMLSRTMLDPATQARDPETAGRGIGATCGEAFPLNFCNKPLPAQHGALFEKH
jgi:hypothetical protein